MGFSHPNLREKIKSFNVGSDLGSHHFQVSVTIPIKTKSEKSFSTTPNFKNADWKAFKELLDSILPEPGTLTVRNKLDIDLLVKQVTDAIETADIKTIPRNKYRSLSKKLPPT